MLVNSREYETHKNGSPCSGCRRGCFGVVFDGGAMRVVLEMNLGLCLRREQLLVLLAFRHGDINFDVCYSLLLLMPSHQRFASSGTQTQPETWRTY